MIRSIFTVIIIMILTAAAHADMPVPAQFGNLKMCQRTNPATQLRDVSVGDCAAYASPADAKPPVYDGTAATIYTDPVFGTKIKRLTVSTAGETTANRVAGITAGGYFPLYAPVQSWSKNETYLLTGGPGGWLYLFQGAEPYTYLRKLSAISGDGSGNEIWAEWSNTDDCILYNTYNRSIRTVNVCTGDSVTVLATHNTLTDTQGNTLDLVANSLYLNPYRYAGISDNDSVFSAKVIDGGGKVYGFGVFSLVDGHNVWFHKITAPGDLVQNASPENTRPKSAQISPDGDFLTVEWNDPSTVISSAVRSSNVVTLTLSAPVASEILIAGASINVDGVPDASFNGQFDNITVIDGTHISYTQIGDEASQTSIANYAKAYCRHYGVEMYDAVTGGYITRFSNGFAHSDMMRFLDGSQAYVSSGGLGKPWNNPDGNVTYRGQGAVGFSRTVEHGDPRIGAFLPQNVFNQYRQWHVSGRGSTGPNGIPGMLLVSSYYEGSSVDASPQVPFFSEIYASAMDGSNRSWRIAHTQTAKGTDYYAEPHATVNRNFTKIIWGSTWRTSGGSKDLYLVELDPADMIPPITTVSVLGGRYYAPQSIVLTADESATIYYTLDGSTPTSSSPVYSSPITISKTTTLKYFARDVAGNVESVHTQGYTLAINCQ